MSSECRCCGGRCAAEPPVELSRRDFLEKLAAGTAALAVAGPLAWADEADAPPLALPKGPAGRSYPLTPPRVYRGKHLEAVAMPLGGIGTGSVWLDGQGRLGVWQIFNNLSEPRIPDSFFLVRARSGKDEPVTRVLQTQAEGPLHGVESLDYEGGYPIARLTFHDRALPVEVRLEAMNPMIPLDTANSSIPCALFRLTAKNPGQTAVEVTLGATLQNAVGSGGASDIDGVRHAGYGGNRNRVLRQNGRTIVAMDKLPGAAPGGPIKVRTAAGREVPGPEMFWMTGPVELTPQTAEPLSRVAAAGGVVLLDGVSPGFFQTLARLRSNRREDFTVFEDFEKPTYEGWTITGDAFGKGPSHGTEGGQQPVTGFAGHGLVNTYQGGDGPQGTATSRPFTIQQRYIGFLIGGGNHPGRTCINLRVGGQVVRTTTGKDREALEPASWDVADLKGRQAAIEIVDRSSEGWGHINIDQIIFSDVPPEPLLTGGTALGTAARALGLGFEAAEEATLSAGAGVLLTEGAPATLRALARGWNVRTYTQLRGFHAGEHGYRALVATPEGDPLLIEGPLGKGRIVVALALGLPWQWGCDLLAAAPGKPLAAGERLVPASPTWGSMALAALDAEASALPAWTKPQQLLAILAEAAGKKAAATAPATAGDEAVSKPDGTLGAALFGSGSGRSSIWVSKPSETINAALAVPFTLKPGESRSVTFAITWHFPNVQRFQHAGNYYSLRWPDAAAVADYLAANLQALWERTRLYHDTLYQSNLPEDFLDAMTSQSVILRGPTCFWSEDGYFGGFEGSYGCCPLNCTHVWNYAQSHARLFPAVGRNMRISNFVTFLHPNGETSHREHGPHGAFIDGHCACIEAAYREYQLSPDRQFLEKIWPGVKKAVDWMIEKFDKDHRGVPQGEQWNTYDTAVSGANTFIGSQYLAALAAGERMALVMGDAPSAQRWRAVREAGMKNQNEQLWNGEYYIQKPDPRPARDYVTGCLADQLLGQWWAHMLGLGHLYPAARAKTALAAVAKYNFREKFAGFKQVPRRYIPDDEGGLLICTWPHGGRPDSFLLYSDEVWTGIEYAAAGAMLYEGLVEDARRIVRMARSRYDGRRRNGLDSGPGGNPYNELECGKFYARAMSSWSLLLACQGLVLEGPKGILGFKPNWQPEDHRSFFTAAEGWGLFVQKQGQGEQTERIEVRHGRLRLRELVFALPTPAAAAATAAVTLAGRPVPASLRQAGSQVTLTLQAEAVVAEGSALEVVLRWPPA
jgi:uncharacterized protein (DUF608 family)